MRIFADVSMKSAIAGILIVAGCLLAGCSGMGSGRPERDELSALDSLIERQDAFEAVKLARIDELKNKHSGAASVGDRYMYNHLLYDEYATYRSDSALTYINASIEMARQAGNAAWETRAQIDKGSLLTASGLLHEAETLLQSIDRSNLDDELLVKYYGEMIFLYSHMGNYAGGESNEYYRRESQYRDSVMAVITPDHPEYLWYRGWQVMGNGEDDTSLVEALERRVDHSTLSTRHDAKEAYMLARLYLERGDHDRYVHCMALSAMADVRSANAEIASLGDLANMVFHGGSGDIDRAYSYINYSLNKAITYPNRAAAYRIAQSLDQINAAHGERVRTHQQRTRLFLILAIVLSAVLVGAVVIIVVQNRRLSRQRQRVDSANRTLNRNISDLSEAQTQLAMANGQLQQLNADLQTKADDLAEANYLKEEYIGAVFSICSGYISKMAELRRNIHVKAVTRRYKEIEEETADLDMRGELREFYRAFDTVFLHIYPNFVADFNALLQPDKQILPKEGELLNTELRIYALVRLGITDSVKIADFLHLSAQTVYNNRFRVRNRAIIPRQDFAAAVHTLGRTPRAPR